MAYPTLPNSFVSGGVIWSSAVSGNIVAVLNGYTTGLYDASLLNTYTRALQVGSAAVSFNSGGSGTMAGDLMLGTQTGLGTATVRVLSLGGTFSSTAGANPKVKLYDDGTTAQIALGASMSQLDLISNGSFAWFVGGAQYARIEQAGAAPVYNRIGIYTSAGVAANLTLNASAGANTDTFRLHANADGTCALQDKGTGAYRSDISIDQNGKVYAAGVQTNTTGAAANVYCDAGTGQMQRSTSSRKYKTDIHVWMGSESGRSVLELEPVTFRNKDGGSPGPVNLGLIAEDVDPILPEVVGYLQGKPDWVQYDRLTLPLLLEVKRIDAEMKATRARVDTLERGR